MSFGGFQGPKERDPATITFHPQEADEYNIPANFGPQMPAQLGVRPKYRKYSCGSCGSETNGRILCEVTRKHDGANVLWCVCGCDKVEPALIIVEKDTLEMNQLPLPKQFHADPAWPKELADLYEESAKSFAAGAYTSSSMVCRKLLMSCVCHQQEQNNETVEEGKSFEHYVNYIADHILVLPQAKAPLTAIRKIGNDANHHVQFVTQADSERSLKIVGHLLNAIYALPIA